MVLQTQHIGYECPICNDTFDDYDACQEHIIDCHNEYPVKIDDEYQCEMCLKLFNEESKAYRCEEKHKKNKDLYFGSYIDKIEKKKLIKAGNHPQQMRLLKCL